MNGKDASPSPPVFVFDTRSLSLLPPLVTLPATPLAISSLLVPNVPLSGRGDILQTIDMESFLLDVARRAPMTAPLPERPLRPLPDSDSVPSGLSTAAPPHTPLAPIVDSSLDYDVLRSWDKEHLLLLDLITDGETFRSLFLQPLPQRRGAFGFRGTSISADNIASLLEWNVIECADRVRLSAPAFLVFKKAGLSRFIWNGTVLNDMQTRPPSMMLPDGRDVLRRIARGDHVATCDAISCFYQFPLAEDIRDWFGFSLPTKRGKPEKVRLKKMAMGWKFAPAVAQRAMLCVANEVLRRHRIVFGNGKGDIVVWLDNFTFVASTAAELDSLLSIWSDVTRECNLRCHPIQRAPVLEILGFNYHCTSHSFQHTNKFRSSIDIPSSATVREWQRVVGKAVWSLYARSIPLATFPAILRLASALGRMSPHATFTVDSVTNQELSAWHRTTHDHFVPNMLQPDQHAVPVWSDAADYAWAWKSGRAERQGHFDDPTLGIFDKELLAAAIALYEVAHSTDYAHLFLDNSAVCFALRAGHSSSPRANNVMHALFDILPTSFRFSASWIPSVANIADPFTRGWLASGLTRPLAHPTPLTTWWRNSERNF